MEDILAKGLEILAEATVVIGLLLGLLAVVKKALERYTESKKDEEAVGKVEDVLRKVLEYIQKIPGFRPKK